MSLWMFFYPFFSFKCICIHFRIRNDTSWNVAIGVCFFKWKWLNLIKNCPIHTVEKLVVISSYVCYAVDPNVCLEAKRQKNSSNSVWIFICFTDEMLSSLEIWLKNYFRSGRRMPENEPFSACRIHILDCTLCFRH